MINTKDAGPIEVWLTQPNMVVTCRVVHEDESTQELDIDSLSMRGAQREITGYFVNKGYRPDGRWQSTAVDTTDAEISGNPDGGEITECMRRFRAPA